MSLEATGITEEQPEQLSQQELDDEAEFNSGFEGDPDTPADEKPADQDTPNTADENSDELVDEDDKQQTQEAAAQTTDGEQPANEAAEIEDPKYAALLAQVNGLRDQLAAVNPQLQSVSKLEERLRKAEGALGAIRSGRVAAHAVTAAGGEAPTQQQIQAAAQGGGEKWKKLIEDFPEFGEAFDERLAAIQPQQQPDVETLRAQLKEELSTEFRAEREQEGRQLDREMRENAVEAKHRGWKETISRPEFQQFLDTLTPIAPSQNEIAAVKRSFAERDFDTANSRVASLTAAYPEWAKAGGVKRFSSRPEDVIELLDAFSAKQARATAKQTNQQRLRTAAAPKTRGTGGPQTTDDEAEFVSGFGPVPKY